MQISLKHLDMKKMPPIEKVYEAWTALADGRVAMHDGYADVSSSDGAKEYKVRFEGDRYASDDNATYWQGYPGYPVIAVLMLQGRLPFDAAQAAEWRGVNWKAVNTKFRNNYKAAVEEVAAERHIDTKKAAEAAETVMKRLETLGIEIKRKI